MRCELDQREMPRVDTDSEGAGYQRRQSTHSSHDTPTGGTPMGIPTIFWQALAFLIAVIAVIYLLAHLAG